MTKNDIPEIYTSLRGLYIEDHQALSPGALFCMHATYWSIFCNFVPEISPSLWNRRMLVLSGAGAVRVWVWVECNYDSRMSGWCRFFIGRHHMGLTCTNRICISKPFPFSDALARSGCPTCRHSSGFIKTIFLGDEREGGSCSLNIPSVCRRVIFLQLSNIVCQYRLYENVWKLSFLPYQFT